MVQRLECGDGRIMLKLGEYQKLKMVKKTDFGIYLSDGEAEQERILLPKAQVPEDFKRGDEINVFIYRDSKDRLIATVNTPYITLGQVKKLRVLQTGKIGAFLDWGLEKDLLLPFREQTYRPIEGEEVLVALYIDKSSRLCATMKVYHYLDTHSPYDTGDEVDGLVYEISDNFGAFVAVDDKYSGLINSKEYAGGLNPGDRIHARVSGVKDDGKLDLSVREKAYLQMNDDAQTVLRVLEEFSGVLPFNDKASPETIRREMNMSKAAFKRAVGHLYKERRVEITETSIRILGN